MNITQKAILWAPVTFTNCMCLSFEVVDVVDMASRAVASWINSIKSISESVIFGLRLELLPDYLVPLTSSALSDLYSWIY